MPVHRRLSVVRAIAEVRQPERDARQARSADALAQDGHRIDLTPLWNIRLRTPRLELRLPNDDELEELYRVAETGIHPPELMPFHVPWTDNLNRDDFFAFHRMQWREWSPEKWTCDFVTFVDGRVIGSQGIGAERFAGDQTVSTGSWLGMKFQGHGYGTEQRAAVLEFAFRGLGARAATSGAHSDNIASRRIAARLGYRTTGAHETAPRGKPMLNYEYRLDRGDWRCPISVEIEGLEPALPLFGAS
jgi:RimJ/RimL family protein N-acetyltransferase